MALLGLLGGFVIRRVGRRALRYDAPDHMAISLLGSSSVTLRLRAWCHDALAAHRLEYASYEEAKSRFAAAGIEIPYPYQNVVLKGRGKEEEGAGEHAL